MDNEHSDHCCDSQLIAFSKRYLAPHILKLFRWPVWPYEASPFASSAHVVRVVLLAMATVTRRVGIRAKSDLAQTPLPVSLVPARLVTTVAPTTRNLCK